VRLALRLSLSVAIAASACSDAPRPATPADELPSHIRRLTDEGERPDWSHDGTRLLFLDGPFGNVFELEIASGAVRPLTQHYEHVGYLRALYLANGDVLLTGPPDLDAGLEEARWSNCELWVLDASATKPAVRLGEKVFEGPAVSRRRMRVAWAIGNRNAPDRLGQLQGEIWQADVVYDGDVPRLANETVVLETRTRGFLGFLETQNYRPPDDAEIVFTGYAYQKTDVLGVRVADGAVTNYSDEPDFYEEAEGIFPDGAYTTVEANLHDGSGEDNLDIYRLALDGSGALERMTFFNDDRGYKADNPVISDDGRFMAFQMAREGDPPGIGYGLFLYDLEAAP
jgi:hypothetical protein